MRMLQGSIAPDARHGPDRRVAGVMGLCVLLAGLRVGVDTLAGAAAMSWLIPTLDVVLLVGLLAVFARAWADESRRRDTSQGWRKYRASQDENVQLRRMFDVTFEAAAVGIAHVDLNGRWLRANPSLRRMLGYSEEELRQLTVAGLTHPDDVAVAQALLDSTLSGAQDHFGLEKRYLCKDGGVLWALVHVALVRDDSGQPAYFVAVVSDLAQRKALEDRLAGHAADLARANRGMEAFSYSVSHDLRAPLRAILGFSDVLLEDHGHLLDGEAKRVLDIIRKNGRYMNGMIDSLLNFARLGQQALRTGPVAMNALVDEAFELARAARPQQRVDLQVDALPAVRVDRSLFGHVWTNLATNALKYSSTRDVSVIQVTFRREADELVFEVRDNGVGFDPAYAADAFKVFHRLHERDRFEGHGVGLAIVEDIVRRHGGRVWAEGKVGAGATFCFALPAAEALPVVGALPAAGASPL